MRCTPCRMCLCRWHWLLWRCAHCAWLVVVPLRAGVVATVARDVVARAVVVDAVRAIVFVDAVRPAVCTPVRDVVTFALLRAVVARDCAPTTPLARDTTDCD